MKKRSCLFIAAACAMAVSNDCVSAFAQTNSTNAAKIPTQSFLGMGGITTIPERRASPHFTGRELPQPPQQKSPWTAPESSLPTNYVTATALLFEQGMADPRGCDYREIEVGTGNIWNGDGGIVKTHGWVLPGEGEQRFAVCWNGLVYPTVSIGEQADLRADARAAIQKAGRMWENALPEGLTLSHESCLPIKGCLLLRLGEPELAKQMWAALQIESGKGVSFDAKPGVTIAEAQEAKLAESDPYLGWASDWAWGLFERAVCAHMRGDDGLALVSARLLTSSRPLIEAAAEHRGFKRQQTYNSPWDGKYQDHLNFLSPLPLLLADQERRAKRSSPVISIEDIKKMTNQTERISALIDRLEEVAVRQSGQPGGLCPWDFDPTVKTLQAEGAPVAEPLLQSLEGESCNRLTRSVSFGRDFHRGRWLHSVSEPTSRMIHSILGTDNFGAWAATNEIAAAGSNANRVATTQIRAWMRKFKGITPEERWYSTLLDDNAGNGLWEDAASNITKLTRPAGVTNAQVLRGEGLRAKQNPSVSELLGKRIKVIGGEGFALTFARWDSHAAMPYLKSQMADAVKASDATDYGFVGYGQESCIRTITTLTLARIQYGDTNAIKEYAEWLGSRKPMQAFIDGRSPTGSSAARLDQLKPAWMFANEPAINEALANLLDNTNSPWRPALVGTNGTIGLAGQLVATTLITNKIVLKYLLTGLAEQAHAGEITFGSWPFTTNKVSVDCKFDAGWGTGGSAERSDKLPEDLTKPMPFRVCDLFAEQLASVDGFPLFAKHWPLKDRDAAISAMTRFIEENEDKLGEMVAKKRKREWWKNR